MSSWSSLLSLSGAVAAAWMLLGVVCVARLIPGYSHTHQVMSALGAKGAPTAGIHPFINNYPIGILFSVFGIYLYRSSSGSSLISISGVLILVHGLSHIVAGIFPCDEDMGASRPSPSQIIHTLSGVAMQISLLLATGMWAFSSAAEPIWFRWLSLICTVLSVTFLVLMVKAFSTNKYIGLYQRVSVGSLILWDATFSGLLHASHS